MPRLSKKKRAELEKRCWESPTELAEEFNVDRSLIYQIRSSLGRYSSIMNGDKPLIEDPGLSEKEGRGLFTPIDEYLEGTTKGYDESTTDLFGEPPLPVRLSKKDLKDFMKIVNCIHVNNHKAQREVLIEVIGSYKVKDVRNYLIDLFVEMNE